MYRFISTLLIFILLLATGCSDRGVNYNANDYTMLEGSYFTKEGAHPFSNELTFQISNKFQQLPLTAYWPKAAFPVQAGGEFKRVPMLVLLPPQDGDVNFYFSNGLKEIADELISTGVIKPMAILCVPNDQFFGGYFFAGSSPAAGLYDSLIGDALIGFAQDSFFITTIDNQENRAIGGIGMGAYGAFRAAILHPGVFNTVSGAVGPMDFDGPTGTGGFRSLFDDVLAEQGITGLNLPLDSTFRNRGSYHLSRLFIGGSYAFSPHDTLIEYYTTFNNINQSLDYTITRRDTIDISANYVSFATATFPNLPDYDPGVYSSNLFGFHLPFDSAGNVTPPIWNRWLANNLESLLTANPNALDGINLWIGNSTEATFGNYGEQTESWKNVLNSEGLSVTEFNFNGYNGHPATTRQYVYDLIKEMLIFHSENFPD